MGRTTKIWRCTFCNRMHISLRYYECSCSKQKTQNIMNTEARAFHLYFSIYRDIVANDEKAKLITTKIVDEIIESHLHKYSPNNIVETINYWKQVKEEIIKI